MMMPAAYVSNKSGLPYAHTKGANIAATAGKGARGVLFGMISSSGAAQTTIKALEGLVEKLPHPASLDTVVGAFIGVIAAYSSSPDAFVHC